MKSLTSFVWSLQHVHFVLWLSKMMDSTSIGSERKLPCSFTKYELCAVKDEQDIASHKRCTKRHLIEVVDLLDRHSSDMVSSQICVLQRWSSSGEPENVSASRLLFESWLLQSIYSHEFFGRLFPLCTLSCGLIHDLWECRQSFLELLWKKFLDLLSKEALFHLWRKIR